MPGFPRILGGRTLFSNGRNSLYNSDMENDQIYLVEIPPSFCRMEKKKAHFSKYVKSKRENSGRAMLTPEIYESKKEFGARNCIATP